MIVNLTYPELNKLIKKLEPLEEEKQKEFVLLMPRANLILDWLFITMLGLEPEEIYKEMLEIYKDNPRALEIVKEAIEGNIYYREK